MYENPGGCCQRPCHSTFSALTGSDRCSLTRKTKNVTSLSHVTCKRESSLFASKHWLDLIWSECPAPSQIATTPCKEECLLRNNLVTFYGILNKINSSKLNCFNWNKRNIPSSLQLFLLLSVWVVTKASFDIKFNIICFRLQTFTFEQ